MGSGQRRSLRRRVAIECVVHSDYWDGGVALAASDLSDDGLWIDTTVVLDEGEALILSFAPPGFSRADIWVEARVARVCLARRRADLTPTGMGLSFTYVSASDRSLLAYSLLGRPPRLPRVRRRPPPLPKRQAACSRSSAADFDVPAVLDEDLAGAVRFIGLGDLLCSTPRPAFPGADRRSPSAERRSQFQ